jgi:hypothetical protein
MRIVAQSDKLSERIGYGGNPEHKRNPGDFNLTPLSAPARRRHYVMMAVAVTPRSRRLNTYSTIREISLGRNPVLAVAPNRAESAISGPYRMNRDRSAFWANAPTLSRT